MKKTNRIILVVCIIVGLTLIKITFFSKKKNKGNQAKKGPAPAIPVTGHIVHPEKLDNKLFTTGTTSANKEVDLIPEVPGKVIEITFKEGTQVTKGQLLVRINDLDLQAQLKKLKLQEKLFTEREGRQQKLLKVSGISQEEYDATTIDLQSIQADMDLLRAQIAKTHIIAPFDGIIGLKNIYEGSYVTSLTRVASIQQIDSIKIDFFIPEKYASLVKKNTKILFTTENSDETFTAIVTAIEPKIDLNTRTLQIRAAMTNKDKKVIPGSLAKIEFLLEQMNNALMIPTEAVIPILKGQKVFISKNGKAQEAIIEIGIRTEKKVQVLKGLQEGDTIIVRGIMQLKPESNLKITSVN